MPRRLSLNNQTDVSASCLEKLPHKHWGLDGELSAWRSFRRGCEGVNQGADLVKKSYEAEGKRDAKIEKKKEKEDKEVDEDVFRLLDLPEELLELLGKYLDVATTLALASTCSLLQAGKK